MHSKTRKISELLGMNSEIVTDVLGKNKAEVPDLLAISQITDAKEASEVFYNAQLDSEEELLALIKWVESAKTIDDCRTLVYNCPNYNDLMFTILIKWIGLCKTIEEIEEVYKFTPQSSKLFQGLTILKLAEIL